MIPSEATGCDKKSGYVYLMEMGEFHKIGQTIDVPGRLMALDVGPLPLRLVHSFASPDSWGDEAVLHRRFASKRTRREWFSLAPEDVAAIRDIERGTLARPPAPLIMPILIRRPARLAGYKRSRAEVRRRFGAYVLEIAGFAGLTLKKLSERSGIPLVSLRAIVEGERTPGTHQTHALARAIGCDSAALRRACWR